MEPWNVKQKIQNQFLGLVQYFKEKIILRQTNALPVIDAHINTLYSITKQLYRDQTWFSMH